MEGNVVSSSSTAFQTSDKHKLNCDRWNDDLCSNITYTKPWYRAEIRKLEAEISKLEANLKEDKQSFSTVHLNDILAKLINKLSKDKQASLEGLDIKGKLNVDGELDTKRLERFTGLCIHDISLTVEQEEGDICIRKHHVHGSCRGIEFEITFLVEENTNQDDRHDTLPGIKTICLESYSSMMYGSVWNVSAVAGHVWHRTNQYNNIFTVLVFGAHVCAQKDLI
jgi:hypothetical protein